MADGGDGKLYTYRMSDRTPVPARDFETLSAAGNGSPRDIWVRRHDHVGRRVVQRQSLLLQQSRRATPPSVSLTVSPRDIIGFDRDRGSYEVGVASMVTRATVSATAADAAATVSITPDDVDGVTDGHQVDLSAGRNAVTVTVTAEDGVTTMDYTVSVNRGVTALTGWKAVDDLDGLIAAGNDAPQGIWSDGTTMWVSDVGTGKLYAYRLSDGARDAAKGLRHSDRCR